jgi:hypothetical protein
VGYTPNDGYGLQFCVMWMASRRRHLGVDRSRACAAALRGASVHLRHVTNESKFTPVQSDSFWVSGLVVISVASPTSFLLGRARVKSLF